MTYEYVSLFDKAGFITKKEMCELLNLDITRPNLQFTQQEINKAYRKRATQFHPDKHKDGNATKPIPEQICNAIMNDIVRAKDHMINGEDNIPGKNLLSSETIINTDFVDTMISVLDSIKSGAETIPTITSWLYYFSSNLLFMGLLSTYSDSQLNLRFVNYAYEPLTLIRPYLENLDGSTIVELLKKIKAGLDLSDGFSFEEIITELNTLFPDVISDESKRQKLIDSLNGTTNELKAMLTDEYINQCAHIFKFWPQLIATIPSWGHLAQIYFFSTLGTATNLPKFINALKVISEAIILNKGWGVYSAVFLPFLITSAIILPINMLIQLSLSFTWIALKASFEIAKNIIKILADIVTILSMPWSNNMAAVGQQFFALLEHTFDLTIRFGINVGLETLDAGIYYLFNTYLFTTIEEKLNEQFDRWFNKPVLLADEESVEEEVADDALIVHTESLGSVAKESVPAEETTTAPQSNFFPAAPVFNKVDTWYENLLENIFLEEKVEETPTQSM